MSSFPGDALVPRHKRYNSTTPTGNLEVYATPNFISVLRPFTYNHK